MSDELTSTTVRLADRTAAKNEARRFGIKQYAFLGVLLRAWKSLAPEQQAAAVMEGAMQQSPDEDEQRPRVRRSRGRAA